MQLIDHVSEPERLETASGSEPADNPTIENAPSTARAVTIPRTPSSSGSSGQGMPKLVTTSPSGQAHNVEEDSPPLLQEGSVPTDKEKPAITPQISLPSHSLEADTTVPSPRAASSTHQLQADTIAPLPRAASPAHSLDADIVVPQPQAAAKPAHHLSADIVAPRRFVASRGHDLSSDPWVSTPIRPSSPHPLPADPRALSPRPRTPAHELSSDVRVPSSLPGRRNHGLFEDTIVPSRRVPSPGHRLLADEVVMEPTLGTNRPHNLGEDSRVAVGGQHPTAHDIGEGPAVPNPTAVRNP